jgi:hypothetical protein
MSGLPPGNVAPVIAEYHCLKDKTWVSLENKSWLAACLYVTMNLSDHNLFYCYFYGEAARCVFEFRLMGIWKKSPRGICPKKLT